MSADKKSGVGPAVERALKKNAGADVKSYDPDAELVAKCLVRHFGDEAPDFLNRVRAHLPEAPPPKASGRRKR